MKAKLQNKALQLYIPSFFFLCFSELYSCCSSLSSSYMRQPAVHQANLGALALALSSTVDAVHVLPPDVFTTHSLTSFKYGQITFSESTSPRISKKRTLLALSSRGFLTQLFFPLNTYLYMKLYLIFFSFFSHAII